VQDEEKERGIDR